MSTATTTTVIPHTDLEESGRVPGPLVEQFRRDGFVRVRGVLDPGEVDRFRVAAETFLAAHRGEGLTAGRPQEKIFTQLVNVWRQDAAMRELTLHPALAGLAEQLTGRPMRIWHDHMLVKQPHNEAATQFHQDRPYWPHGRECGQSLSAWIALVDVPVERGCMTFLPGTHRLTGFRPQNLSDEEDLFRVDPGLRWQERVTLPLRAGDCTFHASYTGHMATPNLTDDPRIAHVVIYMDADTTYDGKRHVVTDGLGLEPGDRLDGELFPRPRA